jgi:hypothetical protein
LFELAYTACEEVGSILINETMGCKNDSVPAMECPKDITVSSLSKVPLNK